LRLKNLLIKSEKLLYKTAKKLDLWIDSGYIFYQVFGESIGVMYRETGCLIESEELEAVYIVS
jgi:hypothetical protein